MDSGVKSPRRSAAVTGKSVRGFSSYIPRRQRGGYTEMRSESYSMPSGGPIVIDLNEFRRNQSRVPRAELEKYNGQ